MSRKPLREQNELPVTHGRISDFAADPLRCMRQLWARHGEVAAIEDGGRRLYFVFGSEYTKQVLSDSQRFHSMFFAVRGSRRSAQRRLTSGLLSMNGEEHRRHRRLVMGPFQKKIIASYADVVQQIAGDLVADWRAGGVRNLAVDMTHYMLRLTSTVLFGIDVEDLAYQVGELTEKWVSLNHAVGPLAFAPDPALHARYDELIEAADELEAAIQELLAIRRSGRLGNDVLSLLIRGHDEDGGISDEQLIGHIALLFGAAHLTSAHTLTWTLFLLAQHPEVMGELHDELSTQLGGAAPSVEQLDALPVLDRVLKESMRILPASAYSQRIAAEPVNLGPFQLQPTSAVIFSQIISHHLPEVFPEPERFLPDRWKTISPSPYAYLPFGAGPRMCIGAALGMMQLKMSLPMMLQQFRVELVEDAEINARVMSTMLFPASAVPARVVPQDGCFRAVPVRGNIDRLVELDAPASQRTSSAA